MKNSYKILTLALATATMTGCADLDTQYLGSVVSSSQKEEVLASNPSMALASVTGCFSSFLTSGFDSNDKHYDFGYTSLMIGLDTQGMDMPSKNIGYNWYGSFLAYSQCNDTGTGTSITWKYMYNQISTCNTLLGTIPGDTDNDQLKFYRAQGLALRAFDYWVLAQLYQFNYAVDASKPCVPLITDENSDVAAAEGCPRASVKEVYDQILADLDEAIDLLSNTTVTAGKVIDSKPKRLISLAAAYGLRARAYLTMHKYAEAAADAQAAINNFSGSPYSIAEVSEPTFISIEDHSWMWGVAVAETDRVITSGIINFPSMMGSFSYGYCTVGAWRWINAALYKSISKTDVRKGWWLDEDRTSPNLNSVQAAYLEDNFITKPTVDWNDETGELMPYTQVKFGAYNNVMGQSTPASDIPLMRIEEMYLILAEATGMSSSASAGADILTNFVQTYRDPSYKCTAADQESFQNECWRQRRIELWGEGFSWFDMMRLNKPLDRVGGGFPESVVYQLPPQDAHLIYCIPLSEVQANKQISPDDNNDSAGVPTPVKDIAY